MNLKRKFWKKILRMDATLGFVLIHIKRPTKSNWWYSRICIPKKLSLWMRRFDYCASKYPAGYVFETSIELRCCPKLELSVWYTIELGRSRKLWITWFQVGFSARHKYSEPSNVAFLGFPQCHPSRRFRKLKIGSFLENLECSPLICRRFSENQPP